LWGVRSYGETLPTWFSLCITKLLRFSQSHLIGPINSGLAAKIRAWDSNITRVSSQGLKSVWGRLVPSAVAYILVSGWPSQGAACLLRKWVTCLGSSSAIAPASLWNQCFAAGAYLRLQWATKGSDDHFWLSAEPREVEIVVYGMVLVLRG